MTIKTLAMLKMEKNFVAHIEKKYPRKPYETYTIDELVNRFIDEGLELLEAIEQNNVAEAKTECADISNIIDYIFEHLSTGDIR